MARQRRHPVEVHALWDAEAEVWSAEGENLPGLVTEAESIEALMAKLRIMVPELLSYSPDLASRLGPRSTSFRNAASWQMPQPDPDGGKLFAGGESAPARGRLSLRSARGRRPRNLAMPKIEAAYYS